MSEVTTSAMPGVINRSPFSGVTPLPPGDGVSSHEIDVNGAQHVTVNVGINGDNVGNVEYKITFIRRTPGAQGVVVAESGTFRPGDNPRVAISKYVGARVRADPAGGFESQGKRAGKDNQRMGLRRAPRDLELNRTSQAGQRLQGWQATPSEASTTLYPGRAHVTI